MRMSLVIPCYNEAKNLDSLLQRCAALGKEDGVEVILVDNGSTDDTARVLAEALPRYPMCRSLRVEKNQGYGYGILAGLRASKGDIIGWTHADMQTDPLDAAHGLALFAGEDKACFVKGR